MWDNACTLDTGSLTHLAGTAACGPGGSDAAAASGGYQEPWFHAEPANSGDQQTPGAPRPPGTRGLGGRARGRGRGRGGGRGRAAPRGRGGRRGRGRGGGRTGSRASSDLPPPMPTRQRSRQLTDASAGQAAPATGAHPALAASPSSLAVLTFCTTCPSHVLACRHHPSRLCLGQVTTGARRCRVALESASVPDCLVARALVRADSLFYASQWQ